MQRKCLKSLKYLSNKKEKIKIRYKLFIKVDIKERMRRIKIVIWIILKLMYSN